MRANKLEYGEIGTAVTLSMERKRGTTSNIVYGERDCQ